MARAYRIGLVLTVIGWALSAVALAAGQVTEAHSGTRKGTVYEATPEPYQPPAIAASAGPASAARSDAAAPVLNGSDGGSAPAAPGDGVEIISGGGSNAGTARVGRLPVLQ